MEPRRLSLTTRGAFALGVAPTSAGAGFALGAEELVLLALALFALIVGGVVQCTYRARVARSHWRTAVELERSEGAVGDELPVLVSVTAWGRGGSVPTWLEDPRPCWRRSGRVGLAGDGGSGAGTGDAGSRGLPNPSSALPLPRLADRGSATLAFYAPTRHRGVYTLPGLRLWCFDSVGLFAQVVGLGPSATVTVHPVPTVVEVNENALRGEQGPDDDRPPLVTARTRHDQFGDFAGLRAYVPGDRLRLLYWPALARTGDLVVRAFEDTVPHRVQVMADVRPLLGYEGTESVLAAAAGVGLRVLALGGTLEFSTSRGEYLDLNPGPHSEAAFLRALAAVDSVPPPDEGRRAGRRRARTPGGPAPRKHALVPPSRSAIVITSAHGAEVLGGPFGSAYVVIAGNPQ
ncbi:MAG TPA: DUF58 domain-containing protein [Acidimicrobiales bacterium]|nr:DUF58 domain-containing protein [Acidimicrobiales bacterium]